MLLFRFKREAVRPSTAEHTHSPHEHPKQRAFSRGAVLLLK